MARYKYQGVAKDGMGRVIQEPAIAVYLAGTTTAASIYETETSVTAYNSGWADEYGYFDFWVDTGDYVSTQQFKVVISETGFASSTYDDLVIFPPTILYSISHYSNNLETAISEIGSTEMTLLMDSQPDDLTASATVPSTLSIEWHQGFELDGAYTLTMNGSLIAGKYQIFGSSLTVSGLKKSYPEWFGAVVDGVTDDSSMITGNNTFFSSGIYSIGSNVNISLTEDLHWDFAANAQLQIEDTKTITISSPLILSTVLSANATYLDTTITLTSVSGIQSGDIITVTSDTVAETGSNYTKAFTTRIVSIAGSVVTLRDPIHFDYTTAESGLLVEVYRPYKVYMNNLNFIGKTTSLRVKILFSYCEVHLRDVTQTNNELAYGIHLSGCVDSTIDGLTADGGTYPVLINKSRNIRLKNLAYIGNQVGSNHMVTIATFTADVYIDGLTGFGALIESHPAFNVNYTNVNISCTATYPWNLRSIGGSITNSVIKQIGTGYTAAMYIQTVALVDMTPYENSTFLIDNLETDLLGTDGVFSVRHGYRIIIKNCKFPDDTIISIGNGAEGDKVKDLWLSNNKGEGKLQNRNHAIVHRDLSCDWSNTLYANSFYEIKSFIGNRDLSAREEHGNHAIQFKGRGLITHNDASADPLVIPLKIYTDHQSSYGPNKVFFILRLIAAVTHSNAGGFDMQDDSFHFLHGKVATSGILYGATSAFQAADTGITNESLTIGVSNVAQQGASQSADGLEHWVTMDVTLTSNRASPKYYLWYAAEYFGA